MRWAFAVAMIVAAGVFAGLSAATASRPELSYKDEFAPGVYVCARCGASLFRSDDKFASTTRWPSFRATVEGGVASQPDRSYGLDRVEVHCARCGLHLGHVFPDGRLAGDTSPEADERYCVLSESLSFVPASPVTTGNAGNDGQ